MSLQDASYPPMARRRHRRDCINPKRIPVGHAAIRVSRQAGPSFVQQCISICQRVF